MTAKELELPELPEAEILTHRGTEAYTADQMRAYALAALASDTGERGVVVVEIVECEDCGGSGVIGMYPGSDFQPPEPEMCRSCGGSGKWRITQPQPAALRAQPAGGGDGQDGEPPLPEGYAVSEFLPGTWEWNFGGGVDEDGEPDGEGTSHGTYYASQAAAVVGAWQDYADTLLHALTQPQPMEGGESAEPPSDEVWPPDGAVWLAPVATDAPANPKLMQYAWGRSSLSSGQMAEAYQCIVSAAQECGQVYRLPVATPPESGGQGVTRVLRDFFFDAANQQHIPTLTVEFEPVKVGVPTNEAKGFQDRDRLAAALAQGGGNER